MDIISLLIVGSAVPKQVEDPLLWIHPNGSVLINGIPYKPALSPGTRLLRTAQGMAYDFDGRRAGMLFGDVKPLAITGSITVSVWLNLRSYVNDGPGAQILFRGDDRSGLDPYTLSIHGDKTVHFGIQGSDDRGTSVSAEVPLFQWTQVTANWDESTGFMKMWVNGEFVGMAKTTVQPFSVLDRGQAPGFSVGNVQNEKGPHNQPVNGQIMDLRIYNRALTPDDLPGYMTPRGEPPYNAQSMAVRKSTKQRKA